MLQRVRSEAECHVGGGSHLVALGRFGVVVQEFDECLRVLSSLVFNPAGSADVAEYVVYDLASLHVVVVELKHPVFEELDLEIQLLGGNGRDPRPNANLCTPGTNVVLNGQLHTPHCTNSSSETFDGDQWVAVEVEVHGNKLIRHKVNGKTVLEYSEPQLDERDADARRLLEAGVPKMLTGGTISLQSESAPIEFRKVELRELSE